MYTLTISHLLDKKHFDKATIVTGHSGLSNQVKWVHILETIDIEQLIHGNELILTTGIHLKEEASFLNFVQQLLDRQVAGLCIEFGQNVNSIPECVIQLANKHNFPILVFHDVIPFIEITKDVHSSLVNQQYQMVKRLEDYVQEINKLTLHARHYEQILMRLYKYLNMHVVFLTNGHQPMIIPNTHQAQYESLREHYLETGESAYFASYDVIILEEKYGELCIFSVEQPINEFDLLILDRTVIALSQFLLRGLYIEETHNLESQLFLEKWLNGQLENSEIKQFIQQQNNYKMLDCQYVVIVEQIKRSKRDYDLTYYKMSIRSLFEKYGLVLFINETKSKFTYIIADTGSKNLKQRIRSCIEKMEQLKSSNYYKQFKTDIAVGQIVNSFFDVNQSYQTANDTLVIRMQDTSLDYFFEDLYVHQILLQIQRNKALMDISQNYLQPLIDYDTKHKSELMHTLQVYLECNGQKNETAEALFIVRQTLYHRLAKIENLIGHDLLTPPKRMMLELMLLAIQNKSAQN